MHNKWNFSDHLWLPCLYQSQLDVVVFTIIYFDISKNSVTEWNHGISTNDKITSNENLENVSTEFFWTNKFL